MQQARDSQAKLQAIVDTALDAVVRMDWTGASSAGTGRRRSSAGRARKRWDWSWTRPSSRRASATTTSAACSATWQVVVAACSIRASRCMPCAAAARIPDRAGDHAGAGRGRDGFEFCAFIRDISERREREQKLVNANAMAEAANIAKSEFLANMSHEIRTPMSAVIGMAYLALRTEMTPRQHDYISKIHRAALTLLGIINDILDFPRSRRAAGSGGDSVLAGGCAGQRQQRDGAARGRQAADYVIGVAPMCRAIWSAIRCGWAGADQSGEQRRQVYAGRQAGTALRTARAARRQDCCASRSATPASA
jgi:signal transduction histidine kinase